MRDLTPSDGGRPHKVGDIKPPAHKGGCALSNCGFCYLQMNFKAACRLENRNMEGDACVQRGLENSRYGLLHSVTLDNRKPNSF